MINLDWQRIMGIHGQMLGQDLHPTFEIWLFGHGLF